MTRVDVAHPLSVTPLYGLTIYALDRHILVLDKPPGMLMHRTHPRPQVSLHEMVRREYWAHGDRIDVVHRLDRETSGLTVLSMNPDAGRALSEQFRQRAVGKRYRAIVVGDVAADRGVVDAPLGVSDETLVRKKQVVNGDRAKAAVTPYTVIGRKSGYTLLELAPQTGRPHQIRAHMAHLGHPLLGDKLYGPDERWHLRHRAHGWTDAMAQALILPRHALHATALEFSHPQTGPRMLFAAPMADDMVGF